MTDERPDPDVLLENLRTEDEKTKGRLRIYFAYAAGVGKTYSMLYEAQQLFRNGADVLVGYIEPHTRPDTMELLEGLPILPPHSVPYKNIMLKEFDLDGALRRKPGLILVDELAHTNAPGNRNKKRYQDIEELLQAGIDVYTTVNVQHIESLNDVVKDISGIRVRETVPDYMFEHADIRLIDIEPEELLKRFENGKVYKPERAAAAMNRFFTREKLRALREIALRKTADQVNREQYPGGGPPGKTGRAKFLVCISSAPSSAKCIRWAARMAEITHSPWVVLHVETPEREYTSDTNKRTLQDHIELAERLGGEIVRLYGNDITGVVAEYAKNAGITNIVIGKGKNLSWKIWKPDIEDRLISMLDRVEIHIISSGESPRQHIKSPSSMIKHFFLSRRDTAKTAAVLIAATGISLLLQNLGLEDQNVVMVYILSVVTVSRITMGYLYGIAASVLSVLLFNFFFTEPVFTFHIMQTGYFVTLVIMLMVALITSTLTMRIRSQAKSAVSKERRTEVLYEINKKLLSTRGMENIVELSNSYMVQIFGRSVIFYTLDPSGGNSGTTGKAPGDPDTSALAEAAEQAVAHWVFVNRKPAGAGTDTLMGSSGYYIPLLSQGKILGVMGISCTGGNFLSQDQRGFIQMIVPLVAMALERQHLSDEQRQIIIDSEKERLRANLLRAISHDLRTPLTSISGASSALLEEGRNISQDSAKILIEGIRDDSQWLIRMVENLLSVTRIRDGGFQVNKTSEAAEEIVAEAIGRVKLRFRKRRIDAEVPEELLLVPMDGTLIVQVLMNLLENAVRHSGDDSIINVTVTKENNHAVFEVSDHGEGIPQEDLPFLFDSSTPGEKEKKDTSRSMGIGLSICMSIVKAHGGTIYAENKPSGGAVFRFSLPLEKEEKNDEAADTGH